MAALNPKLLYKEGDALRIALYRVSNVVTNDTVSVSTDFNRIHAAAAFDATRGQGYDAPAIAGTTVTLDEAAMSGDTIYLLVMGAGA